MDNIGTIYLIHFERGYKHAKHYLGFSKNLKYRLIHHKNGTGANLLRVVKENGIKWAVVRQWKDTTRSKERSLKNRASTRYCPVCNGKILVCFDCGKTYKTNRWLNWHRENKHGKVDE